MVYICSVVEVADCNRRERYLVDSYTADTRGGFIAEKGVEWSVEKPASKGKEWTEDNSPYELD